MKNLIYLVALLNLTQSIQAQDITILDSFHLSEYVADEWEIIHGRIYDQQTDGSVRSINFEVSPTGDRSISSEASIYFDSNGNVVENVLKIYDPLSSTYSNFSRKLLGYDANNNLLNFQLQFWDEELNGWLNIGKSEYSFYDATNNYALKEDFDYSQLFGWRKISTYEVENFYENNLRDSCFTKLDGEPWNSLAFEYDADGLLIEQRSIYYSFGEVDRFRKTDYTYNDKGLETNRYIEAFSISEGESGFMPFLRVENSYTNQDELLENININYDEELDEFRFGTKGNYFYSSTTSIKHPEQEYLKVLWSNAAFNQLNIQVEGLNVDEKYRLSIFDNSGRIIKNATIENSGQWTQRFSMQSGMYHLVIYDEHGKRNSEKLMVH